jgi:hypothetical protein
MIPDIAALHRAMSRVSAGSLLASGIALLALALRLLAGPRPIDDAYITFRYARNLAGGLGLVYNPGQHVLGTSTPLFAAILASIAAATGLDPPSAAVAVSALADAVTAFLVYRLALGLRFPGWAALACAATWCLYPVAFRYAIGGMESSVATALVLAAVSAHLSRRSGWAMALAGLAVLARPDMLAVAAILLAAAGLEARRLPVRGALILAAVLLPWLVVAAWQYGTPIPQSLYAKTQAIYAVPRLENAWQILYWIGGLALAGPIDLAADGLSVYLTGPSRLLACAVGGLLLLAWAAGALGAVRSDPRRAPLLAIPVVVGAAYAVAGLRGTLMAEWYLVPLAPFFFLGLFAVILRACRPDEGPLHLGAAAALGALLLAAQLAGIEAVRSPGWSVAPRIARTEREELYRQAALYLRPHLAPADTVAAAEIGAFGYYCDCRILDTVGLVTPEALRYYPLPAASYAVNYAVPPDLIKDAAPRFLVSLDVFIRRSLEDAEWFRRDYERIWHADTAIFGSRGLEVFRRSPAASGGGRSRAGR